MTELSLILSILLPISLKKSVMLGLQAIYAASLEETIAIPADKHGFRDGNGQFRSPWYAVGRAGLGVAGIAIVVGIIPPIVNNIFPHYYIQSIGLGIIGTTILVNIVVTRWKINYKDYILFGIGILMILIPYTYNLILYLV